MKFFLALVLFSTLAFANEEGYMTGVSEVDGHPEMQQDAPYLNGASDPSEEGRAIASSEEQAELPQDGEYNTGASE